MEPIQLIIPFPASITLVVLLAIILFIAAFRAIARLWDLVGL